MTNTDHNDQKSKSITVTPMSIADWNGLQAVRCVAFHISVWWELGGAWVENLNWQFWSRSCGFLVISYHRVTDAFILLLSNSVAKAEGQYNNCEESYSSQVKTRNSISCWKFSEERIRTWFFIILYCCTVAYF
uniref:7TM_GPCR_Srx domain-containing protein n=1 Tax=Elaeophora elaphi TaxID=1147741 RepID=A0A0R3RWA8_9BILA